MIFLISKNSGDFKSDKEIAVIDDVSMVENYFRDRPVVGLDTETTGLSPISDEIILLQLGDYDNQFVIDTKTVDILKLKSFLERRNKTFIIQNAKFDLQFLYKRGIYVQNVYDTFIAESILHISEPYIHKSLKALAMEYCSVNLDKSIRKNISSQGLTKEVIKYSADDVKYLGRIRGKQLIKLEDLGLKRHAKLENTFVKVLSYVELCGIHLDREKWLNKMAEDQARLDILLDQLDQWIIDNNIEKYIDKQQSLDLFGGERKVTINWNSSSQVIPLMKDLGIDVTTKDKHTGKYRYSVEAKVLEKQKDKSSLIPIYMQYKEAVKEVTTYGENFLKAINPVTGRIHTSFNQIVSTGRMSSGRKGNTNGEVSINLQNIPAEKRTRECFTAQSPDDILVDADFNSQEQIVLANVAQDKDLLDFYFRKEGDMHSFVASKIFPELKGMPLDEIKGKYPELRQKAKSAGFAISYGGDGKTIADNLGIDTEEGKRVYDAYFQAFPGLHNYFKKVQNEALKRGYILINDTIRNKYFIPGFDKFKEDEKVINSPKFWDNYRKEKEQNSALYKEYYEPLVSRYFKKKGEIERMALNFPIQGTSAMITKIAAIHLFNWILNHDLMFKVKIVNIIHDEILLEVPKQLSEQVSHKLKFFMEQAGAPFCKTVKLHATPIITEWWQH